MRRHDPDPRAAACGTLPVLEIRPLFWVSLSVLAFALLVLSFGLVPAIIVQSVLAGISDCKLSLREFAATGRGLSVGATLIFKVGLGVILPAFAWPW